MNEKKFPSVVKKNSAARHDFYDLQLVVGVQPPPRKFRRCDRLAIVLHHDAAWQQLLRDQKFFNRSGQLRLNRLSVGDDLIHGSIFSSPQVSVKWSGEPFNSTITSLS